MMASVERTEAEALTGHRVDIEGDGIAFLDALNTQ
jgi:hypothetical protein